MVEKFPKSTLAPEDLARESYPDVSLSALWTPLRGLAVPGVDYGNLQISIDGAQLHKDNMPNGIEGYLAPATNAENIAIVEFSGLSDVYRNRGIGTRLYRAFTRIMQEKGATHLGGISPSADAIRARARIFGTDSMKFYDIDDKGDGEVVSEHEISPDEAETRVEANTKHSEFIKQLKRKYAQTYPDLLEYEDYPDMLSPEERAMVRELGQRLKGFSVVIDLRKFDTSDWEPDVVPQERVG